MSKEFLVDEDLIQKALVVIGVEKKASSSLFQRRLKLTYAKTTLLMDELERRGWIGAGEGAQPRTILRDPEPSPEGAVVNTPALTEPRLIGVRVKWEELDGEWILIAAPGALLPIALARVYERPDAAGGGAWHWDAAGTSWGAVDRDTAMRQAEKRLNFGSHQEWCDFAEGSGT